MNKIRLKTFVLISILFTNFFTLANFLSIGQSTVLKVKSVPPVLINEIEHVTLYEATIPIFFHMQLPKLPDSFPLDPGSNHNILQHYNCSGGEEETESPNSPSGSSDTFSFRQRKPDPNRDYFCALERQFLLASNHIMRDLKEQRMELKGEAKIVAGESESQTIRTGLLRKKRQAGPIIAVASLVAGFLLRPAISKYTGNLFGTDEEWTTHFNEMRESLLKEHELFLEFEESTHAFTQKVSGALSNLSESVEEQKRDLIWSLHLLSSKMHADVIQDSLNSCKTKHLPSLLVPLDFLRKSLDKVERSLRLKYNYTLAIPFGDGDLGKYYKLPIADCLFSQENAHITLNIPLRRMNSEWKLYETVHTKYAYKGQICELYSQEAAYLAKEEKSKRKVLITNHMLRYCSVFEHQLCMVPQFSRDSVQSLRCTSAAEVIPVDDGNSTEYEELIKSCAYRCYTSNELVVTQVGPRKIVVTNAESISYKCGSSRTERNLKLERLGALEIQLNCNCVITLNGIETLPTPFPCRNGGNNEANEDLAQNSFNFVVPITWSHNFTHLDQEVTGHGDLHKHVNHGWPWLIPVLNFSSRAKTANFSVPEEAVSYGSAFTSIEIWLSVVTIALILNFILTVYCFFKIVLVRLRGYDLPAIPIEEIKEREYLDRMRLGMLNKVGSRSNLRYNNSLNPTWIPPMANTEAEIDHRVFKIDEGSNIEVVRREKRKSGDGDTYESNRNSVVNKLI